MAGAALLAIVVIPILMGYWIRGKIPPESSNPLNRFLIRVYHPLLLKVLHWAENHAAGDSAFGADGSLAAQ
ncbi:cation efflux system protein [Escherichia coli]|uniref:Cation efflux system protein n=1 Tax=Escherichia coli TaxID=562 RepID=A0A376L0F2_ECOLX|nr:cation efflux system protein [Escherichia coli]